MKQYDDYWTKLLKKCVIDSRINENAWRTAQQALGYRADPNSLLENGDSFLHHMVKIVTSDVVTTDLQKFCHEKLIGNLLHFGASLTALDKEGKTPFHHAFKNPKAAKPVLDEVFSKIGKNLELSNDTIDLWEKELMAFKEKSPYASRELINEWNKALTERRQNLGFQAKPVMARL